jgi:ABC-2 type transport system ATP-binding protein
VSLVGQTDDVLSAVGLSHSTNSRIGTLSKGMRQRLGLALALVGRPQVLLLDEPMSGLDPEGRWQVRELIRAQQSAGSTILFSSHVLTDVQDLCGAVTILDHGRVKFSGPLTTADALRHKVIFAAPASPPEGALPFALEVLEPGTFAVTIDAPERLAEVIPQLLASHGARLIQVHPIHLTLEERLRLVGRTP